MSPFAIIHIFQTLYSFLLFIVPHGKFPETLMRMNEKAEHENGYQVSSPSHSPYYMQAESFLLILFNYPTKLFFTLAHPCLCPTPNV